MILSSPVSDRNLRKNPATEEEEGSRRGKKKLPEKKTKETMGERERESLFNKLKDKIKKEYFNNIRKHLRKLL